MARVALSGVIVQGVIEAATKPLEDRSTALLKAMNQDEDLAWEVYGCIDTPENARLARQLYNANPLWVQSYGTSCYVKRHGTIFHVGGHLSAGPIKAYNNEVVEYTGLPSSTQARVDSYLDLYFQLQADKTHLKAMLESLFAECTSLNQAIEAMPSIRDWTTDEVRKRLDAPEPTRAKRVKRSAEELRASVVTGEAASALARVKILK